MRKILVGLAVALCIASSASAQNQMDGYRALLETNSTFVDAANNNGDKSDRLYVVQASMKKAGLSGAATITQQQLKNYQQLLESNYEFVSAGKNAGERSNRLYQIGVEPSSTTTVIIH